MNLIAKRISDFLKDFPPFNMLSQSQLFAISSAVEVHYFEKNTDIFTTGQTIKNQFYVVKDGAVGLFIEEKNILVDECDEGDIFGLRALMRQGNYILSAKAIEETVVYSISSELFEEYITTNSEASTFLMSSFASNIRYTASDLLKKNQSKEHLQDFFEEQSAAYSKNPIQCAPETSIKSAALIMTNERVGSIIITKNKKPLGIITDKDLRTKIATGISSIDEPVTKIMSSPVITYPENITVAEAQIAMLKYGITHLCITEDGFKDSKLIGILSEHDIVVVRGNSPSALVKEVRRAKTAEQLQQIRKRAEQLLQRYIKQQIPIMFATKILSAINESITQKIIDISIKEMPTVPPTSFAWLAIGSQGREEQLLLTDQDNALVFNNVKDAERKKTKEFFLSLSKKINQKLSIVGFELCPANMMASNPAWCLSVSEWEQQFKKWITTPAQDNLILCTIFFDFEYVYGDKNLVSILAESIFESIASHDIFLNFLGLNALKNPPPLSFFRQFLVERDGDHKDQFDVKARAMMPLVDAARLLILSKNVKAHNNTIVRYKKLMELEPQNKDIYAACSEAFKNLLYFRTQQGLLHKDSGRFIDLQTLSKANRLALKNCFKAVKEVQDLIQTRFKLSQFL
ncbi:MAG: CBS domain-containing protein [Polaribacter sp.]|jgi:CBS domain-containing protein